MEMKRTHDDEQDTVTFSIVNFPFKTEVLRGALPEGLRGVQLADSGGVVEADVVPEEDAESKAIKMLFDFYKSGNTAA